MTATPQDSGSTRSGPDPLLALVQSALADRYRIERTLGRGAMAVVYRAHDLAQDRPVAIKVMRPEMGYGDGVVERFRIESRTMAELRHEHIVGVHARGESGTILWFEMDLVEGESLDRVIRSGALEWSRAARLLAQAADALAYAHGRGLIHRDIKPSNLLVSAATDSLFVTDFGVAKIVEESPFTDTGTTVGTAAYMSPEQLVVGGAVTSASDQYSLGIVAYEMLTGTAPLMFDPGHSTSEMTSVLRDAPLRSLAAAGPRDLTRLIERMIAVQPADRWPDLSVVARAAREIAATGSTPLLAPPPLRRRLAAAFRRLFGPA